MNLTFISKAAAEKIIPTHDMAIISIREPAEWVSLHKNWYINNNALELEFHDVDLSEDIEQIREYVYFDTELAEQILDFVDSLVKKNINTLIIHCHAGISRSAAVDRALRGYLDIPLTRREEEYSIYNRFVYRIISSAIYKRMLHSND